MTRPGLAALLLVVLAPIAVAPAGAGAQAGPLTVLFLLDRSISMSPLPTAADTRALNAIRAFLSALSTGDRAAVGRVAGRLHRSEYTIEHRRLTRPELIDVPDLDRFGPSPLVDAIDEGLADVRSTARGQPGLVLLWTDGRSTGNVRSATEVAARAEGGAVRLAIISEPIQPMSGVKLEDVPNPCELFTPIVRASGGTCVLNRIDSRGRRPPDALIARALEEARGSARR